MCALFCVRLFCAFEKHQRPAEIFCWQAAQRFCFSSCGLRARKSGDVFFGDDIGLGWTGLNISKQLRLLLLQLLKQAAFVFLCQRFTVLPT